MISLFSPSLIKITIGWHATGIGQIGMDSANLRRSACAPLTTPWDELPANPSIFSMLSWHTEMSDFSGRKQEVEAFEDWHTGSRTNVSLKFVTGDGGMGKSRLAAYWAEQLKRRKWSAGFVDLRKNQTFPLNATGTLLIVDYPEENRERVKELLRDLAVLDIPASPLRILFLTRQTIDDWLPLIEESGAANMTDMVPIHLGRLDNAAAFRLYSTAVKSVSRELGKECRPIAEDDLIKWLEQEPENQRALFILAAAVYGVLHPEHNVIDYRGRDVVQALAKREYSRLRKMAESSLGDDAKQTFARLSAMAAVAGEIPIERIKALAGMDGLRYSADTIRDKLNSAGLLDNEKLPTPQPDIVAAAFVVAVLANDPTIAPELLWAALEPDIEGGMERIGRLSYDAEVVLGIHNNRISDCLEQMVKGNIERCMVLLDLFVDVRMPDGWLNTAVTTVDTIIKVTNSKDGKARLLNNLANINSRLNNHSAALNAMNMAVNIRRQLVTVDAESNEHALAMYLSNLAQHQRNTGDMAGAGKSLHQAVEILRRLVLKESIKYEQDYASSLQNLTVYQIDIGDNDNALLVSEEVVQLLRRMQNNKLPNQNSMLANSLNTLCNLRYSKGDGEGALDAITEALDIFRQLVESEEARFAPELAMTLLNFSGLQGDVVDMNDALDAIREAIEIIRDLTAAYPEQYEPELSRMKGMYGSLLMKDREPEVAVDAFKEGIDLIKPYAEQYPDSPHETLLVSLENGLKKTRAMLGGE
jgi:tetratricopeptide (TPR) repeat protein